MFNYVSSGLNPKTEDIILTYLGCWGFVLLTSFGYTGPIVGDSGKRIYKQARDFAMQKPYYISTNRFPLLLFFHHLLLSVRAFFTTTARRVADNRKKT